MALVGTVTSNRATVNDNTPSVAVPAGASVGQVYVLVWANLGNPSDPTWPAGFTEVTSAVEPNYLGYARVAIRTCDGTEVGSFTGTTSGYQTWEARCFIVGSVQTSAESASGLGSSVGWGSVSVATGAEVTSAGAGRYALWIASTGSGGGTACTGTVTPPTGFSVFDVTDRGNGAVLALADATVGAGAATFSGSIDFGGVNDSRGVDVLTVLFAPSGPQLTLQPTDQTTNAGGSVTFSASATGATSGQWQSNASGTFADIAGETGTSLTVSGVTYAMQGRQYRWAATGSGVTVYSSAAALRVATNLSGLGTRAAPGLGAGPLGAGPVGVSFQATYVAPILLAASVEPSPAGQAALSTAIPLAAAMAATPSSTGTLSTGLQLAVVVYAQPGGTANLTTSVQLAGVGQATPGGQAALATGVPLVAEVKATPGAQSSLSTNVLLSAWVQAAPDGEASLLTSAGGYSASVEPSPAATGSLATQILLLGSVIADPGGEATLAALAAGLSAEFGPAPAAQADLATGISLSAVVAAGPGGTASLVVGDLSLAAVVIGGPGGTATLTTSVSLAAEIAASPAMRAAMTTGSLAGVSEEQILAILQAELEKPGGVMDLLRYMQTKLDAIA